MDIADYLNTHKEYVHVWTDVFCFCQDIRDDFSLTSLDEPKLMTIFNDYLLKEVNTIEYKSRYVKTLNYYLHPYTIRDYQFTLKNDTTNKYILQTNFWIGSSADKWHTKVNDINTYFCKVSIDSKESLWLADDDIEYYYEDPDHFTSYEALEFSNLSYNSVKLQSNEYTWSNFEKDGNFDEKHIRCILDSMDTATKIQTILSFCPIHVITSGR